MSTAQDFNKQVIDEFRANGGKVGGGFEGAPLLLLHTVGARSGQPHINPVMFLLIDDRYHVFATNGGRERNPDWYRNVLANPRVSIEVNDRTVEVIAEDLDGEERSQVYAEQVARYPVFRVYEERSGRDIPVVALKPVSVRAGVTLKKVGAQ